jgi:hypothetical protein
LGIAQHQIDVPGYGLASFLMGNAHPTGFPRYTAPRCNVFPGAPRHIRHGRTISRVAPSCFLKIGGNHIVFFHKIQFSFDIPDPLRFYIPKRYSFIMGISSCFTLHYFFP